MVGPATRSQARLYLALGLGLAGVIGVLELHSSCKQFQPRLTTAGPIIVLANVAVHVVFRHGFCRDEDREGCM